MTEHEAQARPQFHFDWIEKYPGTVWQAMVGDKPGYGLLTINGYSDGLFFTKLEFGCATVSWFYETHSLERAKAAACELIRVACHDCHAFLRGVDFVFGRENSIARINGQIEPFIDVSGGGADDLRRD
jgi:hypothetical protein